MNGRVKDATSELFEVPMHRRIALSDGNRIASTHAQGVQQVRMTQLLASRSRSQPLHNEQDQGSDCGKEGRSAE